LWKIFWFILICQGYDEFHDVSNDHSSLLG